MKYCKRKITFLRHLIIQRQYLSAFLVNIFTKITIILIKSFLSNIMLFYYHDLDDRDSLLNDARSSPVGLIHTFFQCAKSLNQYQ